MNDTTLPIVKRDNNSSSPSTATTATAASTDAAALLARLELQKLPRKAGARRGFGLHDWNLLLRSSKDLAQRQGQPPRRDIPMQEVQQHASVHDGWVVLYGKVYNLSPYLPYHPGGAAILKAVLGKDGTALFEKYHRWVNIER
jgi:cytochrome-b5 reductase